MAPAWPWPSCKNPGTPSSSRTAAPPGVKTITSVFLDSAESSFTTSSAHPDCSESLSTTASEPSATAGDDTADDAVVRGLRSDRLLFDDPGPSATRSILVEEQKASCSSAGEEEPFAGGVAVALESAYPYADFRASMLQMVAAHGVCDDWAWLEEMLGWYLRANNQDTHCAIVTAFIDVVVDIADPAGDDARSSGRTSSRTFPAV